MSVWAGLLLVAFLALVVAGVVYQRRGIREDARILPPPGRTIDIGGRRLHLYCTGDGPVSVVFEAGIGASSLNWRTIQQDVSTFARACSYDRAGYGWSDPTPGPISARAAAEDLHRLLQVAAVPPPYVLVGHSFGAYVVSLFAAAHPDEVQGIVFVDPITADEWIAPDAEQRRMLIGGRLFSYVGAGLASVGVLRFLLNRVRRGESGLPQQVLRRFGWQADRVVRRLVGEVVKMPADVWPAVRAHWSRARSFRTLARYLAALPRSAADVQTTLVQPMLVQKGLTQTAASTLTQTPSAGAASPVWNVPVTVLSGAQCSDRQIARHLAVATLSPRGVHRRAARGGHWIQLDEPQLVVDAIRALIA